MAELIELEVATPERQLVKEAVDDIQVPGKNGYLGILPGHAPLLGELGTGTLSYGVSGKRWYLAVHGGFVQVLPDHVRILANEAERAEDINLESARAALRQAEEQVARPDPEADPQAALDRVAVAQARVEAAEKR
jgi:F-type H+-transporting ATPase subunit epsilon